MSSTDSSWLRAIAQQYIENIWKQDIYRDFDDEIKYVDGKNHGTPRSQSDIDQIEKQINYYAKNLADILVEELNAAGIHSIEDLDEKKLIKICRKVFSKYTFRFKVYVGSQQSDRK